MRVLHVPVEWNHYNAEQITPLISKAVANYPGLNQIVLHFQNLDPTDRSQHHLNQALPELVLKITDRDS